ncbi:hypothetical protein GCM10011607_12820 [Shewanella inventionis]|uniref:Uncharacterized protein n=1 Tax=Shewanella inventionis TaxID=1738770 RepID=A0ABQ1IZ30_9GAMM|nr:hypothetical protein [Shewanella inventionis]GGB53677.1 hypothetical protein GCM10011607_12820 [Shewanella inventionis]
MKNRNYEHTIAKCVDLVEKQFTNIAQLLPQIKLAIESIATANLDNIYPDRDFNSNSKFHKINAYQQQHQISKLLSATAFRDCNLQNHMTYGEFFKITTRYFAIKDIDINNASLQLHSTANKSEDISSFKIQFDWQGGVVEFASELEINNGFLNLDDSFASVGFANDQMKVFEMLEPSSPNERLKITGIEREFINGFGFDQRIESNIVANFHSMNDLDKIESIQTKDAMAMLVTNYLELAMEGDVTSYEPVRRIIAEYLAYNPHERPKVIDEAFYKKIHKLSVDSWIDYLTKLNNTIDTLFSDETLEFVLPNTNTAKVKAFVLRQALTCNDCLNDPIALYALKASCDTDALFTQNGVIDEQLKVHKHAIEDITESFALSSNIDELITTHQITTDHQSNKAGDMLLVNSL